MMSTEEKKITQLLRSNEALGKTVAKLQADLARANRAVMDSDYRAIIQGLCVRWDFDATPPQRIAEVGERLAWHMRRIRARMESGQSPYEPPKAPREAVPGTNGEKR
jgi:hypothetical protein